MTDRDPSSVNVPRACTHGNDLRYRCEDCEGWTDMGDPDPPPPVPVSDEAEADMDEAEAAWLKWMFENADTFNTDRLSFRAGYRQALLDAAKEIYNGAPDPCQAFYNYGLHPWLRDRAARLAGKDDER